MSNWGSLPSTCLIATYRASALANLAGWIIGTTSSLGSLTIKSSLSGLLSELAQVKFHDVSNQIIQRGLIMF